MRVLGVGGAGNNALDTLSSMGVHGAETIAVNTDAQDLLHTRADGKILIGRTTTRGLGAGNDPAAGERAAMEDAADLRAAIEGCDAVFIAAGMGGGTGTGAAHVMAGLCKSVGVLTIAVATLPFRMEGSRRWENAMDGLAKLEKAADCVIIIPNERLASMLPDAPLGQAFRAADDVLASAIKGIIELVTKPGLVNVDFADLRAIVKDSGAGLISIGESDTKQRASEAVQLALNHPLIDVELGQATGCLVNITGGTDFTLDEAHTIIDEVSRSLDPDARIIWGSQLDDSMKGKIKVLVVITGLRSKSMIDSKAVDGFVDVDDIA